MIADVATRWMMVVVGGIAAIGLVDAATGGNGDLAVVFGAIVVLSIAASLRLPGRRRSIRIRGDLVGWLSTRAAESDEPVGRVVDRAVAAYRCGLTGEREPS
ncbi:hypothetical protein ACGFQG_31245 [Nocardia fluminea]|uniref:hypothetical protein n=1 Tax=Nocardia fluminea TaxID=134984 RepID=UPI003712FB66